MVRPDRHGLRPLLLSLALSWLVGCGDQSGSTRSNAPEPPATVAVAAAANLKFAFDEIETAFEQQHPHVQLEITYGSSGNFFAQLSQRAPFDIFFSADTIYPQRLVDQQLATEESYFSYAYGHIVVWVPNDSPLDLQQLGMQAVVDPSVKKIALANPRLAPYGLAAEEAMKSLGVYEKAKDRLVLGENVTQTAQFVDSGAADVGILAWSLALSPQLSERGRYWEIPQSTYRPIEQAAIIPTWCTSRKATDQLRSFVVSSAGQKILARYGYSPPPE